MIITDTVTYDIPVSIEKCELDSETIIAVKYPTYELNRHALEQLQETVNNVYGEYNIIFIPDKASIEIMPTRELEHLAEQLNDFIKKRHEDEKTIFTKG